MSIEASLASIAKSLESIAMSQLHSHGLNKPATPPVEAMLPPASQAQSPLPMPAAPAPAPVPEVPAFAMPPAAAPAPALPSAPFTDGKTMMEYVMGKYRQLGPVKGGMIQNVLTEIGCKNINEVQPAQYAAFYAKVEAIS